ncbi:MAG: UvrD-helicase domain-containing protein [candidate division NC10 bacterium]|nr:UvrD-helicase domain-containing protein [candidate division NC10 bacterium]
MDTISFLEDLNPHQREAVLHEKGPLLILAGAGSGKTRVIAHRIAYLIGTCGVKASNILAVTFTNKAAEEMRSRVSSLLRRPLPLPASWEQRPSGPFIGTFHSACVKILRQHSHLLGYHAHFAIFDESDQLALVKECLREMDLSEKAMNPQATLSRISHAKNELITPKDYALLARDARAERTAQVYVRYQEKLAASHALDFDDLLMATVHLFQRHPRILRSYQDLWQHILVDEYQDTNHAQYRIISLLAARHQNLCVVGDDDQSIYRWRGADIGNILDFEEDYPQCRVIRLEQNYRSTQRILEVASSVISKNFGRKGKTLWTENERGVPPVHYVAEDEHDEAAFIAQTVRALTLEEGYGYQDFAVLYRTNAQSRVIEEEMRRQTLPYTIIGGVRFYDRKEVKDIVAYLRFLQNPEDSLAMKRIINCPSRGIGQGTLDKVEDLAKRKAISLAEACQIASGSEDFSPRHRKALVEFCRIAKELRASARSLEVPDLIAKILEKTGYLRELEEAGTEEAESRVENLKELIQASREFAATSGDSSLQGFLDSVALISDADELGREEGIITLMTLHSAKGLEFPVVFMAGMEEGIFPHAKSLLEEAEIEEERRLCYVGMTRAKNRLFLISAGCRRLYGSEGYNLPSRFLEEIPEDMLQRMERRGGKGGRARPPAADSVYEDRMPAYEDFSDEPEGEGLRPGLRVRHPEFGVGTIREKIGEGEGMKVTVSFARAGVKRLAVKYANLERA